MTKLSTGVQGRAKSGPRCRWCRHVLPEQTGAGRKRVFCSQACRQWDWVGRQRARELKLNEDELIVARQEIDSLYELACAVDDTERELNAGKPSAKSLKESIDWLLDAARPLRDRTLTPSGQRE
jgi:hypothetical protein